MYGIDIDMITCSVDYVHLSNGMHCCNFSSQVQAIKQFHARSLFYFNIEPRLKWNKTVLAAKIILFHFRRGSMLK